VTSAPPPAKIRAEKLGVRFRGGLEVLRDASFEVSSGEFVVLVGPSGCGKTTLLDAVAAHLPPEKAELSGRILIDGRELRPGAGWPGPLGYVSQKDTLFPWRTVLENVASGLEIQGVAKAERLDRARGLMALAGLSGFEHYFPGQISGGMRQRA
jgi:NitT/TauT family transport system ATP-binding protein